MMCKNFFNGLKPINLYTNSKGRRTMEEVKVKLETYNIHVDGLLKKEGKMFLLTDTKIK